MERAVAIDAQILVAVSRVLHGDRDAFEVVVKEYQGLVLRICSSLLGNREDAEDASQEVFYRAFRSLSSFRLDRRFVPWLISIALNTAKSYYRRRGRARSRRSSRSPEDLPSSGSVEAEGERRLVESAIRTAVSRLPDRLREVVVLYYLEELSVSDVAEAMGLSKENVKSRLHRSRAVLRSFLGNDATGDHNVG